MIWEQNKKERLFDLRVIEVREARTTREGMGSLYCHGELHSHTVAEWLPCGSDKIDWETWGGILIQVTIHVSARRGKQRGKLFVPTSQ